MRTSCNRATLGLAFTAMLLRALLPAGWMPSADTAAPLMLCPGDMAAPAQTADPMAAMPGMASMPDMAPAKAPVDQSKHAHDDGSPCAFGAAAPLSPPSTDLVLPIARDVVVHVIRAADRDAIVLGRDHRPNTARAPPALA